METEAKYYIPEIEEFRVGFECEYFNRYCEKYIPITIDRSNYNIDSTGEYENDYLFSYRGENKFRVKYLDSEDIESLGFVHSPTLDREEKISFTKGNYCIDLYKEDKKVCVRKAIIPDFPPKVINLFVGKIKNLSELKQVLKMIGVH